MHPELAKAIAKFETIAATSRDPRSRVLGQVKKAETAKSAILARLEKRADLLRAGIDDPNGLEQDKAAAEKYLAAINSLFAPEILSTGESLEDFRKRFSLWESEPHGSDYALIIRTSLKGGQTAMGDVHDDMNEGFTWPESGYVEARNFRPEGPNGGGLYGLLDGVGDWTLIPFGKLNIWQVVKVRRDECVPSNFYGDYLQEDGQPGAVRASRGWVIYSGDMEGAIALIRPARALSMAAGNKDMFREGIFHWQAEQFQRARELLAL